MVPLFAQRLLSDCWKRGVKKGPEGPFNAFVCYSSSLWLKIKNDRNTSALQIRFVSKSMAPSFWRIV